MQQVQPHLSIVETQSQQAWIISQHLASPLVQVSETPSLVISQWHMPIVRLQQQTMVPFIMQQSVHIPPCSMVHRFWTMPAATLSSQSQTIFIPPFERSTLKVHRGTIIQLGNPGVPPGMAGAVAPIPENPMPGIAVPGRSIIMLVMDATPCRPSSSAHRTA